MQIRAAFANGWRPYLPLSLCNLRVLCVSVVSDCGAFIYHRDTENTEVALRRCQTKDKAKSLRW
jgi:hypothetical protein